MLSFDEQLESLYAIKRLFRNWGKDTTTNNRHVEVVNENTDEVEYEFNSIPVSISSGTEFYTINIYWEDAGIINFNSKGLYGRYSTSYNEMEYDEFDECLVIKSSNSDKIVKVYS